LVKLARAEVQHAMRHDTLPHVAIATAPPSSELHELLTVQEVAALLKVNKHWVYEHTRTRTAAATDRLPHIKIGKYVRFDPNAVRTFLDRQARGR
jgi:excisionase family DNA binding protein